MSARGAVLLLAAALLSLGVALGVGMPGVSLGVALGDPDSWQARALFQLHLPRVALGFGAGMTLSLAGTIMQALLRNPLADPYILGVSGGAAVGSATFGLLGAGLGALGALGAPLGGFLGALLTFALVAAFGRGGGPHAALRMLLAGIVVNALAGAALMILAALGDAGEVQRTLVRLMGSVGVDPTVPLLPPAVALLALLVFGAALPFRRALDLLALGDATALSLGVDPASLRRRLLLLLSVGVGAVVALTGLIGFVGLVVPHAMRLALGPHHGRLVPVAAVGGGIAVVLADALVSNLSGIFGTELPVGVVTSIVGGPLFLLLLLKRYREVGP
jgi:iron complex transport system permease protein